MALQSLSTNNHSYSRYSQKGYFITQIVAIGLLQPPDLEWGHILPHCACDRQLYYTTNRATVAYSWTAEYQLFGSWTAVVFNPIIILPLYHELPSCVQRQVYLDGEKGSEEESLDNEWEWEKEK